MKLSRAGIVFASLPSLVALGLFYSLAIHMYGTLGEWPSRIGEAGFPPTLVTHAAIALRWFWLLIVVSIFALPVATVVCLLVRPWRHLVAYFAVHVLAVLASIMLMQLAPGRFLYWWRD